MFSWNFLSSGKYSLYKTNTPIHIKRQIATGAMKQVNCSLKCTGRKRGQNHRGSQEKKGVRSAGTALVGWGWSGQSWGGSPRQGHTFNQRKLACHFIVDSQHIKVGALSKNHPAQIHILVKFCTLVPSLATPGPQS